MNSSRGTLSCPSKAHRVRRVAVAVLAAASVMGIVASTLALWTRTTLISSTRFENTMSTVLADPAVTDAIAVYVADQTITAVDLDAKVESILPKELKVLESTIVGGAQVVLENQLKKVLANQELHDLVTRLAVASHHEAVQLLLGDGLGAGVTVANGEVTLNLLPLIGQGLTILAERGLLPEIDLPDFSREPNADAITKLSTALEARLPSDFGQIVVYRSESVARAEASVAYAQRAVAVFLRAVTLIVAATIALIGATMAISTHRRRTVVQLAGGVAATMVLTHGAIERLATAIPQLLADPGARVAAAAITADLTTTLLRTSTALAVGAAVVGLAAWLPQLSHLGPPRGSVAMMAASHGAPAAAVAYCLALATVWRFGPYLLPLLVALVLSGGGVVLGVRSRRHVAMASAASNPPT